MRPDEAAFVVNTTRNASTAFSSFEVVLGFVPKLPHQQHRPLNTESLSERLLSLQDRRTEALANSEDAQEVRKQRYDQGHRTKSFKPGDYVWLQRQQPVTEGSVKLAPKFSGIYKVISQKTLVTYQIECVTRNAGKGTRVVHSSQLKLYVHPHVPTALFAPSISEDNEPSPADLEQLISAPPDSPPPVVPQCSHDSNSQLPTTSTGQPQPQINFCLQGKLA